MPIYAFACESCGHQFDRLQKLSDPDPETCPLCGAPGVHRQVTAPAFRLAGSGWYETDFKKDGDKKRNLADKGDGGRGDGGQKGADAAATAGTDAKPAKSESAAAPAAGKSASASST